MDKFLSGFFVGTVITILVFAMADFTPQIVNVDIERAIAVCKDGEWDKINNTEIHCADGAVYPRNIYNQL